MGGLVINQSSHGSNFLSRDTQMQVKVRLFTTLAVYVPQVDAGETFPVELPEGSDIARLISHLKIPMPEAKIIMVNGRAREPDYRLKNNDEVAMFPPIGGG